VRAGCPLPGWCQAVTLTAELSPEDPAHGLTITGIVDDIYRPGAITAAADDSLEQTATRVEDKDISALVILDGYRLAEIITERDIVRAVADRRDLADSTVGEYMTSAPATVELETPLGDVARTMLAYGVRHLPVVVAGEVIGMVSARIFWSWRAPRRPDPRRRAAPLCRIRPSGRRLALVASGVWWKLTTKEASGPRPRESRSLPCRQSRPLVVSLLMHTRWLRHRWSRSGPIAIIAGARWSTLLHTADGPAYLGRAALGLSGSADVMSEAFWAARAEDRQARSVVG
jgi:CBS domain-containing protein